MNDPGPFPTDYLDANRAGHLANDQKKALGGQARGFRKAELQFALVITVLGLLIWFAQGPAKYATVKPLIGIGCLIIAGFLVVRSFLGADPLTHDLRSGRVVSIEGAITKRVVHTSSRGSSSSSYYFHVKGTTVSTSRLAYDAAPEAGIVRLYYLPHSHRLVNMERLQDTSLPAGAMSSPQAFLGLVGEALHAHDPNQAAEARAHIATVGDAMKAALSAAPAPPAGGGATRPLAESIVGSWTSPFMSLTFAADGTMSAITTGIAAGQDRSGHWSVDSAGRLVSDIMGGAPVPTEAWVSGDTLTVKLENNGLTLHRAGS